METTDEVFASRMRRVRKARGLLLEDLVGPVGMRINSLSRIELGARKVSIGEAVSIASAMDVPLSMLISEDQPLVLQVRVA